MKNIHVIPTDKPSRIFITKKEGLGFDNQMLENIELDCQNQNLYITSDEDIKISDYILCNNEVYKWHDNIEESDRKIILTTDQDLIKNGVQAIDNEFLEWFVQNPSCEEVEIENVYDKFLNGDKRSVSDFRKKYKIIIPKEEQKQDWYCPKCDSYVSAESVTFEETHQICNTSVIDKEEPKQETLEEITEQIQKDCHKFVESIISKVTYQDATNTFLFMKLAELTLKLKKYE